jgi:hypothetical protein
LYDPVVGHMSGCYRCGDTAKVIAIKYVCVATFTHCHDEMGGRPAWDVYEQRARTPKIEVIIVAI